MALQKDTVSINLGMGIDQKDDDKSSKPNTYRDIKDFVFNKFGRIDKRNGQDRLTTSTDSGTIKTSASLLAVKPSGFSHKDQLLYQNNCRLYSYYEGASKWSFKDQYYPVNVLARTIIASEKQVVAPNSATINGLTIYVYSTYRNENDIGIWEARYSVYEESTGNYVIDDAIIEQVNSSGPVLPGSYNTPVGYIQVLTFASKAFVLFQKEGTSTVRSYEVNITTGALGAGSDLITDAQAQTLPYLSGSDKSGIDHVYTNKSGVGERNFVAYWNSANLLKVVAVKSDGTIDGAIGSYTVAATIERSIAIKQIESSGDLIVCYSTSSSIEASVLSFTASSISSSAAFAVATKSNLLKVQSITIANSPTDTSKVYVIWDIRKLADIAEAPLLYAAVCSGSSVTTAAYLVGAGLYISTKPYSETKTGSVFIVGTNYSFFQTSDFLIDITNVKYPNQLQIQAKYNAGVSVLQYSPVPSNLYLLSGSRLHSATTKITRIIELTSAESGAFEYGVSRNIIDISPEFSETNTFLAESTLLTGGHVRSYDGSTLSEANFFTYPEYVGFNQTTEVGTFKERATFVSYVAGTSISPQSWKIKFFYGGFCLPGPSNYIRISNWTTGPSVSHEVRIGFRIDGVGTIPVAVLPTSTPLLVDISKNDTDTDVAAKVAAAINNDPVIGTRTTATSTGNIVDIVNVNNGTAVTPNMASEFSQNYSSTPVAGTYQYKFLYSWTNVSGRLVRSKTSVAKSFTSNGNPVGIQVIVPTITNRAYTDCRVEVYRTEASGTTFKKVSQFAYDPSWNESGQVIFYDTFEDSSISNNELIYTTGGVLDNVQPPASSVISRFKNRVLVSGTDNTTLYYSKTNVAGEPVNFTEEGLLSLEDDGQEIIGHVQMDDKLLVFKQKRIIAFAGDGANDLGVGISWSQPQDVASDVGCVNQNSIQVFPGGVLFKSDKGIYLIDRGLNVSYIGQAVEDYNQYGVAKTLLLKDKNEVRFVLQGTTFTLVYNYNKGLWSIFTNFGGSSACEHKGLFVRFSEAGYVYKENLATWLDQEATNQSYSPLIDTVWMKIKGMQDFQRIYRTIVLGDLKSPHTLNYKIYYDYDETNFDEYNFLSSAISGAAYNDSVYQPEIHLKRQKCDAIRIVMTVIPTGGTEQSLSLIDMSFQVGIKQGLMKVKAGKKL